MSGKLKGIFTGLILLLVILTVVPTFLPDLGDAAATVTDNASQPTVVRTIFGLWWVPIVMLMIAILVNTRAGRSAVRQFRRRRR